MRKIRIGFSRPLKKKFPIFSWLIRLYEGTPYSHVYIRWETKYGLDICYHAASLFLHFLSDGCFKKEIEVVEEFSFDISDSQFDEFMKFCLETCGQDYGLLEVFGIPLMDLLKLSHNPFGKGTDKEFCAELVVRALGKMSVSGLPFDADRVRLKEVYQFVNTRFQAGSI